MRIMTPQLRLLLYGPVGRPWNHPTQTCVRMQAQNRAVSAAETVNNAHGLETGTGMILQDRPNRGRSLRRHPASSRDGGHLELSCPTGPPGDARATGARESRS